MFNYQRFIAAVVVAFCLTAVIAVTATTTAINTQFMENPWSFFYPSPAQTHQNLDTQPLESSSFVSLYPASVPAGPPSNPYWWAFDMYFKPIIREGYTYNESDTACGNCGPGLNPLANGLI